MSDHPQNGSPDPNGPEERKDPAAPQTPPPAEGGAKPFYLRPPVMAGAAVAVVAIIAVIFMAGPSGENGADPQAKAETAGDTADVAQATGWELGRPGDVVMGSPDAPVKLVEYASVTCGHCAAFALGVFPDIKKKYIDTGLVQFTLREFPTPPAALAVSGFMLARCVDEDRYYHALDALFRTQPLWMKPNMQEAGAQLQKISRQFGLEEGQFEACMQNEQALQRINEVVKAGVEHYGINSTPSFVINGRKAEIRTATFEALDSAIQDALPEGTEVPEYTPTGFNQTGSEEPAPDEGASDEGASEEETSDEGASDEGASDEGAADEGTSDEGAADEGAADEGTSDEGAADEGAADEGAADEGAADEGAADEGASDEGTADEGASDEGASDEADSGDSGEEGAPETEE